MAAGSTRREVAKPKSITLPAVIKAVARAFRAKSPARKRGHA